MSTAIIWLLVAATSFVGGHFLLSHPLRAPLVRRIGEKGFLFVYSLVAIGTLGWTIMAFDAAPPSPMLWDGDADLPWIVASVLTIPALALFLASLVGNPALVGAQVGGLSAVKAKGVFRITRHPMMMGFALWAVSHIIVSPTPRGFVLMGAIIVLALVGSHLQDRKKAAAHGRDWRAWMKDTPFWPRLSRIRHLSTALVIAFLLWIPLTWLHEITAYVPAGIWKWMP